MPSDFAAALSDLVLSMALSKRYLPSPKTPSAAGVDSQSFNFGDNADAFVLFIRLLTWIMHQPDNMPRIVP